MKSKNVIWTSFFIFIIGTSSCAHKTSQVWTQYNVPPPEISWSKTILSQEPELNPNGKLSLDRACGIALAYHPNLARSRGLLEAANARIGQTLSAYFPQLQISSSYTRSTSNSTAASGKGGDSDLGWDDSKDSYGTGITARQTIFDFNKTNSAYRQAEHNARAVAHDLEATAATVLLNVREAFLTYLAQNALLSVANETVSSFEKHLKEAETLYEVGRTTKADVAKANVDLSNAKLDLIKARNLTDISRVNLNLALGLDEDPGYQVVFEIPQQHLVISREEAMDQAKKSRPELRATKERFEAAQQAIERAWAKYFPDLSFGLSFDWGGGKFPLVPNWRLGPSLDWDIFNGFRTSKEVKEAEASLVSSRADLAIQEQNIYQSVQKAWFDLKEAEERMNTTINTVSYAEESLRLITGRYQVGRATILEQTDAELALAKARADEIQARYDYELNIARLLRAMGLATLATERK
ncbi:MAG: TolC family protein [bacterium]